MKPSPLLRGRSALIGFASLLALTSLAADHATATAAPHTHAMANATPAAAAQVELGATATFDARGILWAAHKAGGHIAVSRSDDRGKSWSHAVLVTPAPESTDAGADSRPKIATGPGGEIYVTWTRPMTTPYSGEIRLSRSLDDGKTFLAPITVHQNRDDITHRFDAIAVNRRGQVFVAWIDKRDLIAATAAKTEYRGAAVYYAVSDDSGATFRGDFKIADHSCECCRIALVLRADDTVTAMWRHVFAPNIRDHALAVLPANGHVGEVQRASFDDWRMDVCPHHGPSLAEDGAGKIHAVWFSLAPKATGIFYGQPHDNRVDAQHRVGGDSAAHADLAVDGRRVLIAWTEFDGARGRLRAMLSDDGGGHWQEREIASTTGMYDQPRVLAHEGRFSIFWNTGNEPLSVIPVP